MVRSLEMRPITATTGKVLSSGITKGRKTGPDDRPELEGAGTEEREGPPVPVARSERRPNQRLCGGTPVITCGLL